MMRIPLRQNIFLFVVVTSLSLIGPMRLASARAEAGPAAAQVTIRSDFAGGNVAVTSHEPGTVHLAPDLRGDNPWFYWYFEATAVEPGRVSFVFPEKVIGFKDGAIGHQGPAVSRDGGKTWDWMGTETVEGSRFHYDFTMTGQSVRFAVTIPYVQSNLEQFLTRNRENAHLKRSELTKSAQDRPVDLLQIGDDRPDVRRVLVTARHHAAETIASYVLEGFLQEAMSESEFGQSFRERYVLYAVPLVDRDGVEAGDQGKNRKPHDHNRDYGEFSLYPEVRAIKALDKEKPFQFALDFHCPTLVMGDHQVMYFVGAKHVPPYNEENVTAFARLIKAGLPEGAPVGPLVWLRDEDQPSPKNSRYFAFRDGVVMSATLEIPFAPPRRTMDVASCRRYGAVMLQAFVETRFLAEKPVQLSR